MTRILAVLVGVLAVAALLAACGDDGGDGGGEEALTKAEFIKQGDEICAEWEERSETEAQEFAEENDFDLEDPSKEELEEAVSEVLVPALNQQAEELSELGAPEGDEEQVEEIVTSLQEAADEVEEDPSRAFEGQPLDEASRLAADYGFEVCGED